MFAKILNKKNLPLLGILMLAVFFCFYGLSWGLPVTWANDEGGMVSTAIRMLEQKTLYPNRFMYPSLSYYVLMIFISPWFLYLKLSGQLVGFDYNQIIAEPYFSYGFFFFARLASALAGTVIVYFIYLVTKKIYNRKIGLLSGVLAAMHPPLFASAHFAKSDEFMVMFSLISIYLFISAVVSKKINFIYWASLMGGLAISSKYNASLFLFLPFMISFSLIKFNGRINIKKWFQIFIDKRFYFSGLLFMVSFLATTPYAIIKIKKFVSTILFQSAVTRGGFLGFNQQIGFLANPAIMLKSTGYIIFGLLIMSFFFILARSFYKKNYLEIILVSAVIPYYLYLGTWRFNQIHYLIVIFPILIIFMARLLWPLNKHKWGWWLLLVFLTYNLFFSLSYLKSFSTDDNKIRVQKYIVKNISIDSNIESNYDPVLSYPIGYKDIYVLWPNFRKLKSWEQFQGSFFYNFLRNSYYRLTRQEIKQIEISPDNTTSNIEEFTIDGLYTRDPDYIILSSAYQVYLDYPNAYPTITRYYYDLLTGKTNYKIIKRFRGKKFFPQYTGDEIIVLKKNN